MRLALFCICCAVALPLMAIAFIESVQYIRHRPEHYDGDSLFI
jgi:hypothetical protein